MAEAIDVARLGAALRRKRKNEDLKLKKVFEATGISIATLSRIERASLAAEQGKGKPRGIEGETLLRLAEWLRIPMDQFAEVKVPPKVRDEKGRLLDHTPDVVELHLRADKKLNRKTADALARMFRAAYEELSKQARKR